MHFALDLKWRLKCIIIFTFCTRIKNTVISNPINFSREFNLIIRVDIKHVKLNVCLIYFIKLLFQFLLVVLVPQKLSSIVAKELF